MPREIEIDGKKETVYSEDEVKGYKLGSDKNKERKASIEDMQKEIDDLKADDGNRNWSKIRKKTDALEKALADDGKELDDDFKIVDKGAPRLTSDDVQKTAEKASKDIIIKDRIDDALETITDEKQRGVVNHYFKKLSSGEEMSKVKVDELMGQAQKLAGVESESNSLSDTINQGGGQPPRSGSEDDKFVDSDRGKSLASDLGIKVEVPEKKKDGE